jgi:purine-binding chemotaxis protein CheW
MADDVDALTKQMAAEIKAENSVGVLGEGTPGAAVQASMDDFKMVTFSLGGKLYGVNIMNVKEIAKADKFTYVPNASSFVRGVYNLRGDIIPIIDLRTFFHLEVVKPKDGIENMLILHIEDRVYGAIVDLIDKVVGINSSTIQPPHPIFGDINIKYISGVVEKEGNLYLLLDVVRIFSLQQEEGTEDKRDAVDAVVQNQIAAETAQVETVPAGPTESDLGFVKEQLLALKKFYASPANETWMKSRLQGWAEQRGAGNLQLKEVSDAEAFLTPFPSSCVGKFWSDDYAYAVRAVLPDLSDNQINVWNFGCGKGYESYSLACILRLKYPQHHIKIWANDNDIMAIANVPNMVFDAANIPPFAKGFTVSNKNGYTFNQAIKDMIVFEYHDIVNDNHLPDIDIAVGHDVLSYLPVDGQKKVLKDLKEKLHSNGVVIVGDNEELPAENWKRIEKGGVSAWTKA